MFSPFDKKYFLSSHAFASMTSSKLRIQDLCKEHNFTQFIDIPQLLQTAVKERCLLVSIPYSLQMLRMISAENILRYTPLSCSSVDCLLQKDRIF